MDTDNHFTDIEICFFFHALSQRISNFRWLTTFHYTLSPVMLNNYHANLHVLQLEAVQKLGQNFHEIWVYLLPPCII